MPVNSIGGLAALPQRDGWLWAVLPADARRIRAVGGTLAETLAAAGLEVLDGDASGGADAVVVDLPRGSRLPALDAPVAGWIGVAIGGEVAEIRERVARWRRAAELAGAPLASLATLSSALLATGGLRRRAGGRVTWVPTGDRTDAYALGRGWWRRPPLGAILLARAPGLHRPTVLEAALDACAAAARAPLHVRAVTVVESGKVLARVRAETGEDYVLRLGGGRAGALIDSAATAGRALVASSVPAVVRDRVVAAVTAGGIGPVRYALEPWVAGAPPRRMTARLWDECLGFLVSLHAAPVTANGGAPAWSPAAGLEAMEPFAGPRGRPALERLRAELPGRLERVPIGWGHGDLWPQNLITRAGRLMHVLDWDTATAGAPAGFDLFDLLGVSEPGARWLQPGERLLRVLLPLIRRGEDARLRRYCDATGTPSDEDTLVALATAWWIDRVGRDLRDCPDRRVRSRWLNDNVSLPLLAARAA